MFLRVQNGQPRISWALAGQGLRAAIDVGAHRRGTQRGKDPIENELFRRAFWCLIILDVEMSGILGRPVNLSEEELVLFLQLYPLSSLLHSLGRLTCTHSLALSIQSYDATLDFDTEFWEDRGQQLPNEGGSRVEAFVLQAQLSVIAARITAQLYSINPQRQGPTSFQLVQSFQAQLDKWLDSVPSRFVDLVPLPSFSTRLCSQLPFILRLRWDPSRETNLDYRLSANLSLSYNNLVVSSYANSSLFQSHQLTSSVLEQSFLHRPFLPSPQHPISSAPAFIATTFAAAQACVRILDEYDRRTNQILSSGFFACYVRPFPSFLIMASKYF